jgi:hypothetical protein
MSRYVYAIAICLVISTVANAHTINYVLDKQSTTDIFSTYLQEGFTHILPLGFDHVLFIMCIFFLNNNFKKIILQATMFTIAHSLTLALVMQGIIEPPTTVIEPIIALSIAILAVENILFTVIKPWRMLLIFGFGLVHGMGFAGALNELGLPSYAFASALVSFNIGVELGQITVLIIMYLAYKLLFENKTWYRKLIVIPSNAIIALIAIFWTIQRIIN